MMFDLSQVERKRKSARRLEEVSHFFLSGQDPSSEAQGVGKAEVRTDDRTALSSFDRTVGKKRTQGVFPTLAVERHLCLVCSSESLFVEKSFLACSLGIELARRNLSVGLIETTTLPNTFSFLGPFFWESTLNPEPLKLTSIPVDASNSIEAVVLKKDVESDDSRTLIDRVKNESDFLIMNTPPDIFRFKKLITLVNPFFVVPITSNPEELLESYLLIKRVSEDMACREIGLLMMEDSRCQKAEVAFQLIAEMAFNFLCANLRFLGTITMGADFSRSILTKTPLLCKPEDSHTSLSITKLADGLVRRANVSERNH
jgi:hypothetical protein